MLAGILSLLLVQQSALIIGSTQPPTGMTISRPIQVVLLPSQYASLWNSEVQQRLDSYWEQYKPTFAERKELFLKISVLAQKEALDLVVARMQRNSQLNIANLIIQSEPDGKFEFKRVPVGDYKIVAAGTLDKVEIMWSEALEIKSPGPVLIHLKTHVP